MGLFQFFNISLFNPKDLDDPVVWYIRELHDNDPLTLKRLIRSLFEQKVAEARNALLFSNEPLENISLFGVWPFICYSDLQEIGPVTLDFSKTPVLSTPWNRNRHLDALMKHGEGRTRGRWRQDNNHLINWYEPLGIGFVRNGMHSTAQGVLAREGKLVTSNAYDISTVLRKYEVQNHYYVCLEDGNRYPIEDRVWAAIFHAGRELVLATDE